MLCTGVLTAMPALIIRRAQAENPELHSSAKWPNVELTFISFLYFFFSSVLFVADVRRLSTTKK